MIVKSVSYKYFKKVLIFSEAYSIQVLLGLVLFLSYVVPNKAKPIPCIKIVVDCILVEPAKAISPTLQLILWIFGLSMNFLER